MDVYADANEDLKLTEKEISMNLKSKVDVFIERNPTFTRENAMEKLKENIEENNELNGLVAENLADELSNE